jgi:pyruvate dehydrogenase E1 component alpha subunit
MLLIRRFEEKAGQLYGMGLIGGFCHLYIGQEAVVVGLEAAAKEGDKRITSYRDHGHMLACGMDPKGVMAELTGREGGYSKGKGGSMHMFSQGRSISTAATASSARRCRWARASPLPTSTGQRQRHLHLFRRRRGQPGPGLRDLQHGELWKLPVIFVIENNQYAMGTSVKRSTAPALYTGAGRPSASRASRSTAWTCWRSRPRARRRWRTAAPARAPTSSR